MAGYSGTPLARKLGLTRPLTMVTINAPAEYRGWLGDLPNGVRVADGLPNAGPLSVVHVFDTRRAAMTRRLAALRTRLEPAGFVWVSWPKKASKVATDITENVIREVALPMGFVDVKVCAVSEVWSGLKLVIRKSERAKNS
jgi:hypothetical protein